MNYLFFDTETTGLPKNFKASYRDIDNWPRIVQLSWLVSDGVDVKMESDNIIKVDFPIPEVSSNIHGITNKVSEQKGRPLVHVLSEFLNDINNVDVLVCHNLNFDLAVLQSELVRAEMNPEIAKKMFCTMRSAVDFCKLPGNYGYKWPKLEELYKICFNETLMNAHDAMVDVKATHRCFSKLLQEKVFEV